MIGNIACSIDNDTLELAVAEYDIENKVYYDSRRINGNWTFKYKLEENSIMTVTKNDDLGDKLNINPITMGLIWEYVDCGWEIYDSSKK